MLPLPTYKAVVEQPLPEQQMSLDSYGHCPLAGTMHSPDLQVSLPSRLFQDPAELFEAREMLFGAGPPLSHDPGSRPSRKRRAETSPLAALSPVSPLGRPGAGECICQGTYCALSQS